MSFAKAFHGMQSLISIQSAAIAETDNLTASMRTMIKMNAAAQASIKALAAASSQLNDGVSDTRSKIADAKAEEASEYLSFLSAYYFTQAAMETYFMLLRADANNSRLNQIEEYIGRWGGSKARSVVRQLRDVIRLAQLEAKKKGGKLSDADFDSIVTAMKKGQL